ALIETTRHISRELRPFIGNRLRETPTTVQIPADDILELAMQRGGLDEPPVVPYEASAALAMLLLQNHGMLMVHFVGVPPGTADLLIKFVPPAILQRFGGAGRYAQAIDDSLTRLGMLLGEPASIAELLLGTGQRCRSADIGPPRRRTSSDAPGMIPICSGDRNGPGASTC
ncbi:MAG: hypothetical protein JO282_15780, partial [Alphaproteobacteria bacterium]|nr:hypothetical protein [Alphaproteobacteria bacterium]